jgi:hypothetical protein
MTTKSEIIDELKSFIAEKRECISDECDEESMQWQEDSQNEESEFYEISKKEYEKIINDKLNSDECLDKIENFLNNL